MPTWEPERAAVLEAVHIWNEERAPILDALRSLCDLCETLHERITELQKRPWHATYHAMAKWGDAECARIEKESLQREEEPLGSRRCTAYAKTNGCRFCGATTGAEQRLGKQ